MTATEPQTIAQALACARGDLARRLEVDELEITEGSVAPVEFPDASLGAPIEDEMSAQVMTPGWRLTLEANGKTYEYRASARQLRLINFDGANHRI